MESAMYEIKLFDGGTNPFIRAWAQTEEAAISLAKFLVIGEEATWRAEVWSPDGKMVFLASPSVT